MHEPPYQSYSSVWQAGFRWRFPCMNDRTDFTLVWGSLRLAPNRTPSGSITVYTWSILRNSTIINRAHSGSPQLHYTWLILRNSNIINRAHSGSPQLHYTWLILQNSTIINRAHSGSITLYMYMHVLKYTVHVLKFLIGKKIRAALFSFL